MQSMYPNLATNFTQAPQMPNRQEMHNPFEAHTLTNSSSIGNNADPNRPATINDIVSLNRHLIKNMGVLNRKIERVLANQKSLMTNALCVPVSREEDESSKTSAEASTKTGTAKAKSSVGEESLALSIAMKKKFKGAPRPQPFKVRFVCPKNHPECPIIAAMPAIEEELEEKKKKVKVEPYHMSEKGIECKFEGCCHHIFDFTLKNTITFNPDKEKVEKVRKEVFPNFRFDWTKAVDSDYLSSQNKNGIRKHIERTHEEVANASVEYPALAKLKN